MDVIKQTIKDLKEAVDLSEGSIRNDVKNQLDSFTYQQLEVNEKGCEDYVRDYQSLRLSCKNFDAISHGIDDDIDTCVVAHDERKKMIENLGVLKPCVLDHADYV